MDDQSRRNDNASGNGRHASSENERGEREERNERGERGEGSRQHERSADRSPLTKREREEQWPIG